MQSETQHKQATCKANEFKYNGGKPNNNQHANLSLKCIRLKKLPQLKANMRMARNLIVDGRERYYPTRRLTLCTLPAYSLRGINEISQWKQDAAIPYLCVGATGHRVLNYPMRRALGGEAPESTRSAAHGSMHGD